MLQRVFTRVSKPAARYSDRGSMAEHCSACRFFMSGGDCARVLGRVLPQGWCKYFSREAVQRWNPLWPMAGIPAPPGATLDLSFMNPGTLDPRVSFTRASGGTYFDRNGVMQNAAVNLLLQSANLAIAPWTLGGAGSAPTVTANQATAPDGTLTAARIALSVTSGTAASFVYQMPPTSTVNPYVFSVYLRGSVGGEQIYLFTTPDAVSFFRQPITLGLAWQRFSLITPSLTATNWFFALGVDLRDGGQAGKPAQTIYAWGAQLELGSTASPYIPTTSTPMGAPRWDYNPSTLALQGLLIEEARTNLALSSGNMAAAPWAVNGATVTGNQAVAPDGTMSAAQLALTTSGETVLAQAITTTTTGYAYGVWMKGSVGGEQTYLMTTPDGTLYHSMLVTLTTAWQRYVFNTPPLTAAPTFFQIGVDIRDSTQTVKPPCTIYAWGAQVEQGAFPTSYIPTAAAAVTRSQDQCSIQPASMGWFVSPGGSWYAEFIPFAAVNAFGRIIGVPSGAANVTPLYMNSSYQIGQYDGASLLSLSSNGGAANAIQKASSTWVINSARVCLNGGPVGLATTLTGGYGPLITSGLLLFSDASADNVSGYIRRLRYWPRILTDAEMQQVTT